MKTTYSTLTAIISLFTASATAQVKVLLIIVFNSLLIYLVRSRKVTVRYWSRPVLRGIYMQPDFATARYLQSQPLYRYWEPMYRKYSMLQHGDV